MKDWKTTAVGIAGLSYLVIGFGLVYLKVYTLGEFSESLAPVSLFIAGLIGYFAKDSKKR